MISVCGLICEDCKFLNNPCEGCYMVKGKTFWNDGKTCVLYDCAVNEKDYNNCGDCSLYPCDKIIKLKVDGITKEEHLNNIKQNKKVLNNKSGYVCSCINVTCKNNTKCRQCSFHHLDKNNKPACIR